MSNVIQNWMQLINDPYSKLTFKIFSYTFIIQRYFEYGNITVNIQRNFFAKHSKIQNIR